MQKKSKDDWYIHYVIDGSKIDGMLNIHTHGMHNYEHLDFQLVLPVSEEQAVSFLNSLCYEVKNGRKYTEGEYDDDLFSCKYRLELYRETDRDVLRLILPDTQLRFPEDRLCQFPYNLQMIGDFYKN